MHPLNQMLQGMARHFLADGAIAARIGERLYRGMSAERARAHENPAQEVSSPLLEFVEYELAPAERGNNQNVKRGMIIAAVEFRFFSELNAGAAELFDLFNAALITQQGVERYHGTWNERKILGARWDESSLSEGRDDAIRMAQLTCTLIVPFVAR